MKGGRGTKEDVADGIKEEGVPLLVHHGESNQGFVGEGRKDVGDDQAMHHFMGSHWAPF